jgi:putative membrane-bound dehydrogenase-like protein
LGLPAGADLGLGSGMKSLLSALVLTAALAGPGAHAADSFPQPYDTGKNGNAPMSAEDSAKSFKMPPGFKVSVFAGEPDVRQPIAMTFDPRGRLWVAENYTYAEAGVLFATNLSDRVLIFEDTHHDGHFDKRTVFYDRAKILTSVEVGYGGVFLMCPPRLLFIPDKNGDDIPDGEPEVLLDGFTTATDSHHTFANGLKWGPDGWLWGRVGITSKARVGVPGTPDAERVPMNGGIWRYHPGRHVFEAVSHGTTNPWGMDWNAEGEPFFINTVIGHFWHAITGAHFERMHGADVDPHSYALIPQHADHYHFDTGAGWTKSRAAQDGSTFAPGSDNLGGGHAHTGLMIYQGDNWPAQYRGKVFTLNFHGRRINMENLERDGSGYVARHAPDFLTVGDPWFRGIDLIEGPDGSVYIADWSDTGECHNHDGVNRSSGRIYKVTYGDPARPAFGDLTKLSNEQLLPLLTGSNEWAVRQARQLLATRTALTGKPAISIQTLTSEFDLHRDLAARLRVIWALNAVGAPGTDWLLDRIQGPTRDRDEQIRSWAARLLAERFQELPENAPPEDRRRRAHWGIDPAWPKTRKPFLELAATDPAASVRLTLASLLPKVPSGSRTELATALIRHAEDATDHNLPLMLWYGTEPLVSAKLDTGIELALASEIPTVRRFIARRLAEEIETDPAQIDSLLKAAMKASPAARIDFLTGLGEAWQGWRKLQAPEGWSAFRNSVAGVADAAVSAKVAELDLLFGDGRVLDGLRAVAADTSADPATRRNALHTVLQGGASGLAPVLKRLADDNPLRADAMVGLLQIGDVEGPAIAIGRYQSIVADERTRVLGALVTRPAAATALLQAIADGKIPRVDLTPFLARQIAGLGDPDLTARLTSVWGAVRATDGDKRAAIDRFRIQLSAPRLRDANLARGRQLFTQTCAGCHTLYGEGGKVGPDLTGSDRASLDYLLENIVDPSAVVPADYRMTVVTMKDGRSLNGLLRDKTERTLTIQTPTERTTVERREIESVEESTSSMMPDGLLESYPPDDQRDLVAYLMHPTQVPPK